MEFGYAEFGCKNAERYFVIPQVEVDFEECVACFERFDNAVYTVVRYGVRLTCLVIHVQFGDRHTIGVSHLGVVNATVDLRLICVRVRDISACNLDIRRHHGDVVVSLRACVDEFVVCLAISSGHIGFLYVRAVLVEIVQTLACVVVRLDSKEVSGASELADQFFARFDVCGRRVVGHVLDFLFESIDDVCSMLVRISCIVRVERNRRFVAEFAIVELDCVLTHKESKEFVDIVGLRQHSDISGRDLQSVCKRSDIFKNGVVFYKREGYILFILRLFFGLFVIRCDCV